jgi:hypothetical protein
VRVRLLGFLRPATEVVVEAVLLLISFVVVQSTVYRGGTFGEALPGWRLLSIGFGIAIAGALIAETRYRLYRRDWRTARADQVRSAAATAVLACLAVAVGNAFLPNAFRPFRLLTPVVGAPVAVILIAGYRLVPHLLNRLRGQAGTERLTHQASSAEPQVDQQELTRRPSPAEPMMTEIAADPHELPREWRWVALASGIAALETATVALIWVSVLPFAPAALCCDAGDYTAMAQDPVNYRPASVHAARVLVPWLVHLIGTQPVATYHVISLLCLFATGPLVYAISRRLGASRQMSMLGMAALLLSRGWTFYLLDPWLSDPAAFVLIAAAFLALVSGRGRLLAPLLLVLAMTRELFVGLALPIYAWQRRQPLDIPVLIRVGLQLLPAVAVYELLTRIVPSAGPAGSGYLSLAVVQATWYYNMGPNAVFWVSNTFALSFGIWWLLALPTWRDRRIRKLAWWLVPVFAQLAVGTDWSRYAVYAFPVVFPAAALALDRLQPRGILLGLIAVQMAVPWLDLHQPSLDYPGLSLPVTVALMVVTAIVLLSRAPSRPALHQAVHNAGERAETRPGVGL